MKQVQPGIADLTDGPMMTRRLARLREELADEGIPVPFDGPAGPQISPRSPMPVGLLDTNDAGPTYASLVFDHVPDWDNTPDSPMLVTEREVGPPTLRRCADGRSSFTVTTPEGMRGPALFDRSFDDELAAVRLQRSGAVVLQRSSSGLVRVCTAAGVVGWDGSTWLHKPRAEDYVALITSLAPHADVAVVAGLLESAVHALASVRVGATVVWNLDRRPLDDQRGGLLEFSQALRPRGLTVARRVHFPALVSLHSQVDLATIVGVDGDVGPVGARLNNSRDATSIVPAAYGARHTSARRFTFDVPGVIAIVVSESGRVTVFAGGGVAAHITEGRRAGQSSRVGTEEQPSEVIECATCGKPILVVVEPGDAGSVDCPVCSNPLSLGARAYVLGVPVPGP